jgi:hypothetical protein
MSKSANESITMQRCPKCNRTYQDDKQKFCTHDGGRLQTYEPPLGEAPTSFDLGATMRTDSSDLGETLLDKAAELNKTMAAPHPPPPSPQLNRTVAAPSPSPANIPAPAAAPPPPPAQQPPPQKTIIAPPPQQHHSPSTGEIRPPTGTMPTSPPTSELSRPQATTGFTQPMPPQSQPSSWSPTPPAQAAARPQTPTAPSGHVDQFAPQAAATAPSGQSARPAGKSSRTPRIVGGVVVLLLLVAAASVVGYFMLSRKSEPTPQGGPGLSSNTTSDTGNNTNTGVNANTASNVNANTRAFEAPPNSLKFVNSRTSLDGKLAEYYADFSFYYPRLWTLDPKSGVPGASNFVKVDRMIPPNFRQESFAVGWYDSKGTIASDRANFPGLVNRFSQNLGGSFPNYEKVSEGDTKINDYNGYEFRFKSVAEGTDRGDVTVWGRVLFLPPEVEGSKNGLVLLMFTTSVAAELSGVEEVGQKGELSMIIDTFRLGTNP